MAHSFHHQHSEKQFVLSILTCLIRKGSCQTNQSNVAIYLPLLIRRSLVLSPERERDVTESCLLNSCLLRLTVCDLANVLILEKLCFPGTHYKTRPVFSDECTAKGAQEKHSFWLLKTPASVRKDVFLCGSVWTWPKPPSQFAEQHLQTMVVYLPDGEHRRQALQRCSPV